jgi:hypothetical protein
LYRLRWQYAFTSMTTKRDLVEKVYANVEKGHAPMIIEVQMGAPPFMSMCCIASA